MDESRKDIQAIFYPQVVSKLCIKDIIFSGDKISKIYFSSKALSHSALRASVVLDISVRLFLPDSPTPSPAFTASINLSQAWVISNTATLPSSVSIESAMPSISSKIGLILSKKSGPGDAKRSEASSTSGLISSHAFAIEIVSSAGGADSDESDSEPLQLVRAIAIKANAKTVL